MRTHTLLETREELEQLYKSRREIYLKHSTIQLECEGSPVENAERIAAAVRK